MTDSTAIEKVDPFKALEGKPLIDSVSAEQLSILGSTIAPGLSRGEMSHFLELSRSLGMSPWRNEIWAAKSRSGKVLMMVGRDGLLGYADRNYADYQGFDTGVVYENDHFERADPNPDGKTMRERAGVIHRQGHPKDRGAICGAWAVCERAGRPIRYFYCDFVEYKPAKADERSTWTTNPAVMIEKCPLSLTHRTLCGLGSVYLEEEVARVFDVESTLTEGAGDGQPEGIELSAGVEAMMGRATELGHAALSDRGTVEMAVGGQTEEIVARWLVHAENELNEMAETGVATETETEPVDAEVVPETAVEETEASIAERRRIADQLDSDAATAEAEGHQDEAEQLRFGATEMRTEADTLASAKA